jgi:hypothetical protein
MLRFTDCELASAFLLPIWMLLVTSHLFCARPAIEHTIDIRTSDLPAVRNVRIVDFS